MCLRRGSLTAWTKVLRVASEEVKTMALPLPPSLWMTTFCPSDTFVHALLVRMDFAMMAGPASMPLSGRAPLRMWYSRMGVMMEALLVSQTPLSAVKGIRSNAALFGATI